MFASDLYIIEIKEDWIFDKQRSRQYFDIQSITIKIPAEANSEGLEKTLASFKYKELESYFRLNPNCIWYNAANTAKHINLADAFELRLFNGRIVKKSNALNKYLDQVYKNPKQALQKSQELEYELMEFENNLWEY
jgi:gliding motility associated protien GldN